ncbi:polysaccharide deacetylase family protein [Streptomyces sp. NPDC059002]|uniref:polysaccharide deacetylase family protein n=1 Tax=Streptomyces sp. NPDC059002 TaxID=3346690 RepID=UPI00368AA1A8
MVRSRRPRGRVLWPTLAVAVGLLVSACHDDGARGRPGGTAPPYAQSPEALPTLLAAPPVPTPRLPLTTQDRPVRGGVPAIRRVPTSDRVVFLTIDDGQAKDPGFRDLMNTLRIPFSMFLTDSLAGDGYPYFAGLEALGNKVQNHTLTHRRLTKLPATRQRAEICGQQERLRTVFGHAPTLFRPPGGNYNATTQRAAADCGLRAVVLWTASMQPGGLRSNAPQDALRSGDIILFHFFPAEKLHRRTLRQVTIDLARTVTAQGFALARIEDYLDAAQASSTPVPER